MDPDTQDPAAGARPGDGQALVDELDEMRREREQIPVGWLPRVPGAPTVEPHRPIWLRRHPYYLELYCLADSDGVKTLADGREVVVMPWSAGGGQLSVGWRTDGCFVDTWDYQAFPDAVLAAEAWDGTGEPAGWYRHPATGRRRRDGDPATEWIQP